MNFIGTKYTFENTDKEHWEVEAQPNRVYISPNEKWAKFKCPCGCGDDIVLNLIPGTRPTWKIQGNSITPSIHRLTGCKSHFHITNGVSC